MAVRVDDPHSPQARPRRQGVQTAAQMQSQRTFPGFFNDTFGNAQTIEGGIGVEVPGFEFGLPGVATVGAPGGRIGIGGTVKDVGKHIGGGHATAAKPMEFSDYLALAQQYLDQSGSGAPDYSAIEQALQQHALESDAKLAAMYKQLHGSIDSDAPTIAGQYDQAAASINQNADQASGNVNGAYQASRDDQTRQLEALGIQDAARVLASNGGNAAADQAHAVGNIEQNRQVGADQTALNKGSALDYNTNIGNASSLAGSEARGSIQGQLMDALAQIALKKSEAQGQSGQSAISLAMQLQDRSGSGQPTAQDQQDFAKFQYGQKQDAAQTYLQLLKQYDGDQQKAAQAFAQLQASGLI